MLKKLASRILPDPVYASGRRLLRGNRRARIRRLPALTEARFQQIASHHLGIGEGSVVFVHSSIDRLNLGFPFYKLLTLLMELVGEEGTLLFPCTHLSERPEDWLRRGEVFDVLKSPTTMGVIPEFARRRSGAARSRHPTSSVVAIGKQARELTRNHALSIYPCGIESPYFGIVRYAGIIVGIGVTTDVLTFVHCVEDNLADQFPVYTRPDEVFVGKVRDETGRVHDVETLVAARRIRWRAIRRYMRRHVSHEVCQDLSIDGVPYYTARAPELYKTMETLAHRGITIYSRFVHDSNPLARLF